MEKKPYSHIDYLSSLVNESPEYLDSCWIAELWAAIPEKIYEKNKPFWLIRDNLKKLIDDAIIKRELGGIIEERAKDYDDGFKEITDKNRIRKIKNGKLGSNFVVFTVYRDKFKDWLIKSNQWPIADDCLLNKWFEGEQLPEAVEDVGLVSHAGTGAKTIQPNTNELDYSGFLKEPKRKDSWFRVIDDMTRAFHSENGKMPNEHQARARLWAKPPEGYEITTGMDRGEECLRMPTERPLSKSAFTKRWTSYTQ